MNSAAAYRQYLQDLEEKRGRCMLHVFVVLSFKSGDRLGNEPFGAPAWQLTGVLNIQGPYLLLSAAQKVDMRQSEESDSQPSVEGGESALTAQRGLGPEITLIPARRRYLCNKI